MNKIKYNIGYVSKYLDLPQSVIRYWETVFDQLKPEKTSGGTRKYHENDIIVLKKIKKLLYDQKFTIKGANKLLNSPDTDNDHDESYVKLKKSDIKSLLDDLGILIQLIKSNQ